MTPAEGAYGRHPAGGSGNRPVVREQAALWLYDETLLFEFSHEPLAQYSVAHEPNRRHFKDSPQPTLWELSERAWLQVFRVPFPAPRCKPQATPVQPLLFR
jgi:hypothetical protein